jgi:hypothetical protein
MSASKNRLRWQQVPAGIRSEVERLAGGQVLAAVNCADGFSPGLASRLTLAGGRMAFVKAMDAGAWPDQVSIYRAEAAVAAALPREVLAPRLLGSFDDRRWVVLVFECVDGAVPDLGARPAEAYRVAAALGALARRLTPAPVAVPARHPRLGGWAELARDRRMLAGLPALSGWATERLADLIALEAAGLSAARGGSLVHFDAYPHNILLTKNRVVFVDWPHARLGAPFLDLIMFASSAAAAGLDPEPILAQEAVTAEVSPPTIDAVLAAHAGFCVAGGLEAVPAGLAPIAAAKASLGRAATNWLERRLRGQEPDGGASR